MHYSYQSLWKLCLSIATELSALALLAIPAVAGPFSQLVVFGDSLSDVGNVAAASFGIFPGRYYYNDRFSDGPVFVEALSTGLGLGPSVRSTAGGSNFAYGGAQTSGTGGLPGIAIRDIDEQVEQYLATRTVDSGALFLVFAGANDLVGGQGDINVPVDNLSEDIGRLIAAGARNFLVPNLPLLGYTPRFNSEPSAREQYNTRTEQFNTALDAALINFAATNSQLEFFRLDVAALFNQAISDPAAYGLTNVTDAAAPGLEPGENSYNTGQIAANANEYIFWDDLHPTATVHAHLAERALALFALPGDYNQDQAVDAADYVVWRDMVGQSGTALAADGNGDDLVDEADYNLWRMNFGFRGTANITGGLVPEPRNWLLFSVALIILSFCRVTEC